MIEEAHSSGNSVKILGSTPSDVLFVNVFVLFVLLIIETYTRSRAGDVAQMAERVLSMHEAQGSIPCFSTFLLTWLGSTKKKGL